MRRWLPALHLALGATFVLAQGDPLESPECRQALDALQAQEKAALAAREGGRPGDTPQHEAVQARLEALRERAASACLASRPDVPAPRGRMAQPPLAVPPAARPAPAPAEPPGRTARPPGVAPAPAVRPPAVAPTPAVPPATRVGPPTAITMCDSTGCWTSDGTRLQRFGPALVGPRGVCSVVGGVVTCP